MSGTQSPGAQSIGPNAIIQTLRALVELEGAAVADEVAAAAALPETRPTAMIPEAWFIALVRAVRERLPAERAEAVLRLAGHHTAGYVATHRVPRVMRGLLSVLPARLGVPILLGAFRQHAWTFAGSGRFQVEGAFPGVIHLKGAPSCCAAASPASAPHHEGAYYEAAFEGLLRLAAPTAHVREIDCQSSGAPACRFAISLKPDSPDLPQGAV